MLEVHIDLNVIKAKYSLYGAENYESDRLIECI